VEKKCQWFSGLNVTIREVDPDLGVSMQLEAFRVQNQWEKGHCNRKWGLRNPVDDIIFVSHPAW
jgi:hypothetical protein